MSIARPYGPVMDDFAIRAAVAADASLVVSLLRELAERNK